jgi:hypothetical protein
MNLNKILQKQENYKNFLKKELIKNPSSLQNSMLILLIIYIIFILFHSFIIYYLVNLKKCLCFEELNNTNYSNINYLIIIESITLLPFILGFISTLIFIFIYYNKKQKGGAKNSKTFYVLYGIMLLINIYFLYNVKKLAENIKEDCECSHSWIRYLLYIYSIYMVFVIISGIITIFLMN